MQRNKETEERFVINEEMRSSIYEFRRQLLDQLRTMKFDRMGGEAKSSDKYSNILLFCIAFGILIVIVMQVMLFYELRKMNYQDVATSFKNIPPVAATPRIMLPDKDNNDRIKQQKKFNSSLFIGTQIDSEKIQSAMDYYLINKSVRENDRDIICRAVQQLIGASVDGKCGKNTNKKISQYYKDLDGEKKIQSTYNSKQQAELIINYNSYQLYEKHDK